MTVSDFPERILPEMVAPGTRLGPLLPQLAECHRPGCRSRLRHRRHDTASAVAAVPAEGDGWCYISSGTWSLMGVEIDAPVIDARSLALNFTNEAGVAGTRRGC